MTTHEDPDLEQFDPGPEDTRDEVAYPAWTERGQEES